MIDISIEQGNWSDGSTFWRIPKGAHIDTGDIIRMIKDESVIGVYVVQETARRDINCQGCQFNKFMGSHTCLLVPNPEGRSAYRRICDIPGTWATSRMFTDLDTILENL